MKAFESRIATRCTEKQRAAMERAAKRAGLELGAWARLVLVAASSTGKTVAGDVERARAAGGVS